MRSQRGWKGVLQERRDHEKEKCLPPLFFATIVLCYCGRFFFFSKDDPNNISHATISFEMWSCHFSIKRWHLSLYLSEYGRIWWLLWPIKWKWCHNRASTTLNWPNNFLFLTHGTQSPSGKKPCHVERSCTVGSPSWSPRWQLASSTGHLHGLSQMPRLAERQVTAAPADVWL